MANHSSVSAYVPKGQRQSERSTRSQAQRALQKKRQAARAAGGAVAAAGATPPLKRVTFAAV